tara:strand:+ start:402 stop:788 length:387 start_codon:yes stop_codon:yes gene_type:complete
VIVIDSNILIDYLRGHAPAKRFIMDLPDQGVLFSAVVETELLAGQENKDVVVRAMLLQMLSKWSKVPVDNTIAMMAGDIVREYGVQTPDALVAATALESESILYTNNIKHFHHIKNLKVRKPYSQSNT